MRTSLVPLNTWQKFNTAVYEKTDHFSFSMPIMEKTEPMTSIGRNSLTTQFQG